MHTGHPGRDEIDAVIELVVDEARRYLDTVDQRLVIERTAADAARSFRRPLPEAGDGAAAALRELIERGVPATVATSGPRFFHFVTGGATPAALGADWLTGLLDQQAYTWIASPLAVELELVALDWLKELFGLPVRMTGVMTTGASMANFVGLAAARQWWAARYGVDVAEEGMAGLPPMPVFSSGYIHASSVKVLSMLGVGRRAVRRFERDDAGRLDPAALERALRGLDGAPAVLIAAAGEVNAGDSDPIAEIADLADAYDAWLHVDGAFGMFAAVSPRTADQVAGAERADSVTADGHKWLNVPYDCGFAFVRDRELLARAFAYTAHYLPGPDDGRPTMGAIGPESSRRARSLAVWATLRAYGRAGTRAMVERHLDLARQLAVRVDAAPDLERLAPVPLNIVCFRYNPGNRSEAELDSLNRTLGERILADGRVYVGTTRYRGHTALRPALVNWRTGEADVDLFIDVVRELAREVDHVPA